MRSILFYLVTFLLSISTHAQVFNAGFEDNNGTPLRDWTKINADQNPVEDWMPVPQFNEEAWVQFYDFYDNKIAFSTSFYMNGQAANDWLVSPAISIPSEGNATLYWRAKSYDNTAAETYAVKISTTDQQMESFTDLEVVEGEQAYEFNARTADLSAYAGQDIYIAFVNQTSGGYFLALDDVYISTSDNCYGPSVGSFAGSIDVDSYLAADNPESISFEVSWEEVGDITNYDVGVTTFTVPVESNGVQSQTTKVYENMSLNTRYQMFVKNADCGSGWFGPKSIFTPTALPYEHGFEPTVENYGEYDSDGWTSDTWIMGVNESLASAGEGYIFSNTSSSTNVNKWLYSYPMIIEENVPITITFDAGFANDATENAVLKVGLTDSNAVGSIPTNATEYEITPGYNQISLTISEHAAGMLYVAFGNVTEMTNSSYALRLDNISITKQNMSTSDIESTTSLHIYPNPVKDFIYFRTQNKILSTKIFDINGKLVKSISEIQESSRVDISDLPKGAYILDVEFEDKVISKKILKK